MLHVCQGRYPQSHATLHTPSSKQGPLDRLEVGGFQGRGARKITIYFTFTLNTLDGARSIPDLGMRRVGCSPSDLSNLRHMTSFGDPAALPRPDPAHCTQNSILERLCVLPHTRKEGRQERGGSCRSPEQSFNKGAQVGSAEHQGRHSWAHFPGHPTASPAQPSCTLEWEEEVVSCFIIHQINCPKWEIHRPLTASHNLPGPNLPRRNVWTLICSTPVLTPRPTPFLPTWSLRETSTPGPGCSLNPKAPQLVAGPDLTPPT